MREVINMTQEADYRQAYETLDSALRQATLHAVGDQLGMLFLL